MGSVRRLVSGGPHEEPARKNGRPRFLWLTCGMGRSRSLFIGGGQRGLRFGGRLLCLLGSDGWMIWLVSWVICCFCCLVLVLVVWFCWIAGVDRVIWVA